MTDRDHKVVPLRQPAPAPNAATLSAQQFLRTFYAFELHYHFAGRETIEVIFATDTDDALQRLEAIKASGRVGQILDV